MSKSSKLEKLAGEQARLDATHQWSEALVTALGNPAEWRYEGECIDAGEGATMQFNPPRCACGHPIRFCFLIHHSTKGQTQVGSECINYFEQAGAIHEQLTQALGTLEKQIAQAKVAALKAKRDAEAQALTDEYHKAYNTALDKYLEYRDKGLRAPRRLWELIASNKWALASEPPPFTRSCDIVRWCKKHISMLQEVTTDIRQ
jgi:hypothetical protein